MIPNEYLYYFYFGAETIEAMRDGARAASTCSSSRRLLRRRPTPRRAAGLARRARTSATAATWPRPRRRRAAHARADDAGGYEGEAMAVVEAIAHQRRAPC